MVNGSPFLFSPRRNGGITCAAVYTGGRGGTSRNSNNKLLDGAIVLSSHLRRRLLGLRSRFRIRWGHKDKQGRRLEGKRGEGGRLQGR